MKIGLTFDLREDYDVAPSAPPDLLAEFDSEESIGHLAQAIGDLGHEVARIGDARRLVRFLAAGHSVDLVFNMAEGTGGRCREGQVPSILEAYRVPCTGSDPLTLAMCLDKAAAKRVWRSHGLPTPDFWVAAGQADVNGFGGVSKPFPLFVKPVHEGSSMGICAQSVVWNDQELAGRVDHILQTYHQPALVESFMPGREFTVGLLGAGRGARVLGVLECAAAADGGINDYACKAGWEEALPGKFTPLAPGELRDELEELALAGYRAVECRDLGRLEIRLDAEGAPHLLEINPIVGLHPTHSAMSIIARHARLSYRDLIAAILAEAMGRVGPPNEAMARA